MINLWSWYILDTCNLHPRNPIGLACLLHCKEHLCCLILYGSAGGLTAGFSCCNVNLSLNDILCNSVKYICVSISAPN